MSMPKSASPAASAPRSARPVPPSSARSCAPRPDPWSIRSSRCRMTTTGASICGARTIRMTTRSSATSPAPHPARPPARRTSPFRATSIWLRRAAIWTRSSSSSRITRSRPFAAASATAAARTPAPAATLTAPLPLTRSRSLSPSRSCRPTSATSRRSSPTAASPIRTRRRSPSSAPARPACPVPTIWRTWATKTSLCLIKMRCPAVC